MKIISNAKYGVPAEEGTIFEAKAGGLNIAVHRIIGLNGWYLSCAEMMIERISLKSETLTGAIKEAEIIIKKKANKIQEDAGKFSTENIEISKY